MDEVLRLHQCKLWPPWPLSAAEALPRENVCTVEPEGAGTTLSVNTEEGALRPSRLTCVHPRVASKGCSQGGAPETLMLCALLF